MTLVMYFTDWPWPSPRQSRQNLSAVGMFILYSFITQIRSQSNVAKIMFSFKGRGHTFERDDVCLLCKDWRFKDVVYLSTLRTYIPRSRRAIFLWKDRHIIETSFCYKNITRPWRICWSKSNLKLQKISSHIPLRHLTELDKVFFDIDDQVHCHDITWDWKGDV